MNNTRKTISLSALLLFFSVSLSGCGTLDLSDRDASNSQKENQEAEISAEKLTVKETPQGQQETQSQTGSSPTPSKSNNNSSQAPTMEIDKTKKYSVVLKTTEGDITIELSADKTPVTVNNFLTLARKNFYDSTIFHRVMKGFMIQGGDPSGDGTGGPGYQFADEPFEGSYSRGTVAMANSGPNTNGSQFFIMHADYALPKNYVIFGKVTNGLEAVDKIAEAPVAMSASGEQSKPVNPVKINSVEVVEK